MQISKLRIYPSFHAKILEYSDGNKFQEHPVMWFEPVLHSEYIATS